MIALTLLGIVAGLVLLSFSADQFVIGAARLSTALRLSPVVIGAVVIGFGTSAPELVVSGLAASRGALDLAVANVVGSNLANLSLVLGAAALVDVITVDGSVVRREAPISLAAVAVFAWLVRDGLSRPEGLLLGALLVAALTVIVTLSRRGGDEALVAEVDEFLADGRAGLWLEGGRTLLGLLGTLVGAQLLVSSALSLAAAFSLAEGFVGVTVVALGTSLPELATSLQAVRKGETDLILGNLLGSNVFNSLAVGAAAGLLGPGPVADERLISVGVPAMLVVAGVAVAAMVVRRRIGTPEGGILLVLYLATLPILA